MCFISVFHLCVAPARFIWVFHLCVSSVCFIYCMCFIRVFHHCVSSVCFICVFHPCSSSWGMVSNYYQSTHCPTEHTPWLASPGICNSSWLNPISYSDELLNGSILDCYVRVAHYLVTCCRLIGDLVIDWLPGYLSLVSELLGYGHVKEWCDGTAPYMRWSSICWRSHIWVNGSILDC